MPKYLYRKGEFLELNVFGDDFTGQVLHRLSDFPEDSRLTFATEEEMKEFALSSGMKLCMHGVDDQKDRYVGFSDGNTIVAERIGSIYGLNLQVIKKSSDRVYEFEQIHNMRIDADYAEDSLKDVLEVVEFNEHSVDYLVHLILKGGSPQFNEAVSKAEGLVGKLSDGNYHSDNSIDGVVLQDVAEGISISDSNFLDPMGWPADVSQKRQLLETMRYSNPDLFDKYLGEYFDKKRKLSVSADLKVR